MDNSPDSPGPLRAHGSCRTASARSALSTDAPLAARYFDVFPGYAAYELLTIACTCWQRGSPCRWAAYLHSANRLLPGRSIGSTPSGIHSRALKRVTMMLPRAVTRLLSVTDNVALRVQLVEVCQLEIQKCQREVCPPCAA
jgi:hypothetical protein